jgi:hypothetical protein
LRLATRPFADRQPPLTDASLDRRPQRAHDAGVDRATFLEAARRRGIDAETAAALHDDLYGVDEPSRLSRSVSDFGSRNRLSRTVTVLVWVGTIALIGAHAWWSTDGYESLGIGVVLALTLVWQTGFLVATEWARRRGYARLEEGFATIVVFYTPLTVYSLERALGVDFRWHDFDDFYPWVSGGWVFMELVAIAAALLALARYQRPLLMLPLTLFVGFLAMDGATRAFGGWDHERAVEYVVLAVGIVALAVGVVLDYRGWRRFAFWPHLGGMWLVGWGLDLVCGGRHTLALFLSAAIAFALGVWLARVAYLAAGGILGWGALSVSAHGALFPFLLMIGGIGFIVLAVWLARVDSPMRRWLASRGLPAPQRDLAF